MEKNTEMDMVKTERRILKSKIKKVKIEIRSKEIEIRSKEKEIRKLAVKLKKIHAKTEKIQSENDIIFLKIVVLALFGAHQLEDVLLNTLDMYVKKTRELLAKENIYYSPDLDKNSNAFRLLKRLQTFLPTKKYPDLNKTIMKAIISRNKFIHNLFINNPAGDLLKSAEEAIKDNPERVDLAYKFITDLGEAKKGLGALRTE